MGLGAILMLIFDIFLKLPEILQAIRTIMDLIKMIKDAGEQKAAKAELKAVLLRYRKVNKRDPQQVAYTGKTLKAELDALRKKLESKVQGS